MMSGITADDQILVAIHRALDAADRQAQRREDIGAVKARRAANRRRRDRRWAKDAPAPIAAAPAP